MEHAGALRSIVVASVVTLVLALHGDGHVVVPSLVADRQFGFLFAASGDVLASVDVEARGGRRRDVRQWLRISRIAGDRADDVMRIEVDNMGILGLALRDHTLAVLGGRHVEIWEPSDLWRRVQVVDIGADCISEYVQRVSLGKDLLVVSSLDHACVFVRTQRGYQLDAELAGDLGEYLASDANVIVDGQRELAVYARRAGSWTVERVLSRPHGIAWTGGGVRASSRWIVAHGWDTAHDRSTLLVYDRETGGLVAPLSPQDPATWATVWSMAVGGRELVAVVNNATDFQQHVERWSYADGHWQPRGTIASPHPIAVAMGDLTWIGNPTFATQEIGGGTIEGHR